MSPRARDRATAAALLAALGLTGCGVPDDPTVPVAPSPARTGPSDAHALARLRAAQVAEAVERASRARERRALARREARQAARARAALTPTTVSVPFTPGGATADDFARLRGCESGGNYATNTGNGYYGAYQFALGTWRSTLDRMGVSFGGLPSEAPPSLQDAAARSLQSRAGWAPWPSCSAQLGLR